MRRTVQKSLREGHSGGGEEPTSRLTAPMIPRKMTLPKEYRSSVERGPSVAKLRYGTKNTTWAKHSMRIKHQAQD